MAGTKSPGGPGPQAPRAEMDSIDKPESVVVPVVSEEMHSDAIPVQTGGVRVTKRVDGHDEILEQELRKGRVEVKRVKTDRVVDGPQNVQRVGNTLIVPVVSEVLRVQKQWVVTEEIHITQIEERETVQQKVHMNEERAQVERLDASGNAISSIESEAGPDEAVSSVQPGALKRSGQTRSTAAPVVRRADKKGVLSGPSSLLKDKGDR